MLAPEKSTLQIAIQCIRLGWAVVPIATRSKAPKILNWPSLRILEAEAPQYFNRPCNIGVILGRASGGLADVDLDCVEAIDLAPEILKPTPTVFGRESKLESHWIYAVEGACPTEKLADPLTGGTIVELRGDGGLQTVFPGSIHPSGERIEWSDNDAPDDRIPAVIDTERLRREVRKLAAYSLVKRYHKGAGDLTDDKYFEVALKTLDHRVIECVQIWLGFLPSANGLRDNGSLPALGPIPAYLTQAESRDISAVADQALKTVYSPAEHARLVSALAAIPANERDSWVRVGMALKELDWERPDGTSISFELWDAWSQTCPDKYSLAACEGQWRSFKRSGVSVGSIYHMAREHGWAGGAPAPPATSPKGDHGPGLNGDPPPHRAAPRPTVEWARDFWPSGISRVGRHRDLFMICSFCQSDTGLEGPSK